MNPTYAYVALIDVLSYKFRLENDENLGQFKFKDDLVAALSVFDTVNSAVFGVQAISDTIILTCSNHENILEFLKVLKDVFLAFLNRGLYVRGGIAYSRHFQSGRLTYSHAVARAHEIESKFAIYPRIVIDQNIIEMYSSSPKLPPILEKGLFIKHNEVSFLHVIDELNWDSIYDMAKERYKRDMDEIRKNESAFSKHQWFENYLFAFAGNENLKPRYIEQMVLF